MKVALAPEGTRGDVYPLLDLGERLRAEGHEPIVCGPPGFAPDAAARQMAFRPTGSDVHGFLAAHAGVLIRGGIGVLRAAHRWVREAIEVQFEHLPGAVADCGAVIGSGMQVAGPSAAELAGLPYRYVVFCPGLLPSPEHPPVLLPLAALPRPVSRLAWRATRAFYDRVFGRPLSRERATRGLAPIDDVFGHLLTPHPVIAADALLAPVPAAWRDRVTPLECLNAMDPTPLPPKLESFLEWGPPPVYLGFGSMPDPDPTATTRVVLAAIQGLGCRAVVSAGWAGLGDGPLPEHVLAIGAVSHARLFPRVAAVVHHGGAGTTTMAARAGTPQLVVPHGADQHYWGERVRLLGLGPPPLPRRRLDAGRLASRLAETLDHEVVAERAAELGERLRADLGGWRASDLL